MDKARVATGIIFLIIGVCLIITSFWAWFAIIYGVIALVIGIVLLFDVGKENFIEPIKYSKTKNIKTRKK